MAKDRRSIIDNAVRDLRQRLKPLLSRSGSIGEENTKRVLITPLIEALNWNVLDLDEVQNEYRAKSQDNPVDYAMFLLRSPCLFLEAKALDQSLNDRKWIGQTIAYASVAGVAWCVLTNGNEYSLYNAHAPVDADKKLFRSVMITNEDTHNFTVDTLELISKDRMQENQIDTLWKVHFVDHRVKAILEDLFRCDDSFIRLIAKREGSLTPGEIQNFLHRADVRITFPISASSDQIEQPPPGKTDSKSGQAQTARTSLNVGGRVTMKDILDAGIITAPLELSSTYKKQTIEATVEADGRITFNRELFSSPSHAGAVALNRKSCNGWIFWHYRNAHGEFKPLNDLRQAFQAFKIDQSNGEESSRFV